MPSTTSRVAAAGLMLALLPACGAGTNGMPGADAPTTAPAESEPAPTHAQPPAQTSVQASAQTSAQTTAPPAAPSRPPQPTTWTMPDLVGHPLQDAQDAMQELTGNPLFVTLSHDATGQDRNQVLDANWKVCSQNVPAGSPVTLDTKIDFGVVKLDESCP